ncbi:MAG: hypothetical protein RBR81_11810 [Bacteroidales bacterium]|jgi:hypothetical protein|nr:hypothetical protein [Bacteroidales bacterium]
MDFEIEIPEPLLFSPLKHYLPFIRDYVNNRAEEEKYPGSVAFIRELKHLGNCVMDIYDGDLAAREIFSEVKSYLDSNGLAEAEAYRNWAGTGYNSYKIIVLSDNSQWTLKHNPHEARFVHIFPARSSSHTFRVKANTLKSAILYLVLIGKDYISEDDLNKTRALAGLSPVKEVADAEAVTEMIEILRR